MLLELLCVSPEGWGESEYLEPPDRMPTLYQLALRAQGPPSPHLLSGAV